MTRLYEAMGKRIAVGPLGSGTYDLANYFLPVVGLTPDNTTLLNLSFADAAQQLADGAVDVAIFVVSDSSPLPGEPINTPDIELMSVSGACQCIRLLLSLAERARRCPRPVPT